MLEISKTKLGDDHPDTLSSMHNLNFTWRSLGRSAEKIVLTQQCMQQSRKVLRDDHPNYVSSLRALEQWEAEEAEESDAEVACGAIAEFSGQQSSLVSLSPTYSHGQLSTGQSISSLTALVRPGGSTNLM